MRQTIKNTHQQAGYILIELAIVLIAAGVLLTMSIPLYKTYIQKDAIVETNKRMDIIAKAFSNHIQMRGRLPCPADPTGAAGITFGIARTTCTNIGPPRNSYGIIPYRTIGIPEQYAKDGWGNYFTYAVSPDFTADTEFGVAANQVQRRFAHVVAENKFAMLPLAQFCAPLIYTNTDLIIRDEADNPLYTLDPRTAATVIPRPVLGTPNANLFRDDDVAAIAMAIISHGENGYGSYANNGAQISPNSGGGIEDATNQFNGIIRVKLEWSSTNSINNEYDDIIKFYTQNQILGAAGGGSCEHL